MAIKFPCPVKQIGVDTVQFEADELTQPLLNTGALDEIAGHLSAVEQDKLTEDIVEYALTEAMKRGLVMIPVGKAMRDAVRANLDRNDKKCAVA